ncbi:MAG TPA: SH3-like domain-containing protein [Acetobacteraceae bacterium]|nr:SH3-like domain-containing protein [Acetobacteraceae bacterium]HUB44225.1 SH3-like domain-containing protein [Acetobacteraceae bacterium]
MDSLHDLGGRQGFGRVNYPDQPHNETWEPVVRALSACALRNHIYNMDEFRHAIERMAPRHYVTAAYYERHLTAVATLLMEKGIVTREELESLAGGSFPLAGPIGPGRLPTAPQSFAVGEIVRVKNEFVPGHVRAPAYIRGKTGVVVGISPSYPFPDAAGHGMEAPTEPTYDIRFCARDLWPDSSDDAMNHVGVFQSYLEKVGANWVSPTCS